MFTSFRRRPETSHINTFWIPDQVRHDETGTFYEFINFMPGRSISEELVRYIHLNPLRAGLVEDMKALDKYLWCGHSVLMAKNKQTWQNVD